MNEGRDRLRDPEGGSSSAKRTWIVIVCFTALALLLVPVYPHFVSPNELSRWATVASIVEHGSIEVSWLLPLLGPRMEDLSAFEGQVYSNKAPGGALVALPFYAVARSATGPPTPENIRLTLYACRLLAATIPAILLALLMIRVARISGAPQGRASWTIFALLFATPVFPYSLLFFSHVLTAFLLFGAWALLFVEPSRMKGADWNGVAAGALIGLSVMSEYTTALPAAILIAAAIFSDGWRRVAWILVGGAPFAAFLAVYQHLAFGSVLAISSGHERFSQFQELASHGLFGIGFPSPETLLRELLDPSKGLLILSPFLILAPLWYGRTRRALSGPAFLTLLVVPLAMVAVISGYPNWHGGWTVGVRYLVPVLPFLVYPMVHGRENAMEPFLVGASVVAIAVPTLTFPFVPEGIPLPWFSFGGHLLLKGLTAPVWTDLALPRELGWLVLVSLILTAVVAAHRPLARTSAALGWTLAGAATWVLLPVAILQFAPLSPVLRLQRAYIEEVYFEQAGAMSREFPESALPPGILRRKATELQLPPSSWPFASSDVNPKAELSPEARSSDDGTSPPSPRG